MTDSLLKLAQTLAEPGQPESGFRALERLFAQQVGQRLFTILEVNLAERLARRSYTSDPEAYPVSGTKEITENKWTRIVIDDRQPFIANTLEEIAEVFPDYELIGSLGCGSVINLPVRYNGEFLGTVNLLHEPGYYTPSRVKTATALSGHATLALLGARTLNHREHP